MTNKSAKTLKIPCTPPTVPTKTPYFNYQNFLFFSKELKTLKSCSRSTENSHPSCSSCQADLAWRNKILGRFYCNKKKCQEKFRTENFRKFPNSQPITAEYEMMLISYMDDANILFQIGVSYSCDWCSMIGCKEIWNKRNRRHGTYNPQGYKQRSKA